MSSTTENVKHTLIVYRFIDKTPPVNEAIIKKKEPKPEMKQFYEFK